jgi:hypothetical protein
MQIVLGCRYNRPFCSPHNTLKLELIAASSMQHDSQPQMLTTEEEQGANAPSSQQE